MADAQLDAGVESAGSSRRGRPNAESARQKHANVLEVARELFAELGYRAVTMRLVAEQAQVSTRTLYNHYADKLSLIRACLDIGATEFPEIRFSSNRSVMDQLADFAASLVRALSTRTAQTMGMLVFREGTEFPELLVAAEDNQDRHLVKPLAIYLSAAGLAGGDAERRAKLFIAMAISEWQRSVSFHRPLPEGPAVEEHAAAVARLFVQGARAEP